MKKPAESLTPPVNARREAIIHAAWRMAAAGGLGAVTIRSIAAEHGLTTGAVMHHFPTKEAILEEMIARLYMGLQKICSESVARAKPQERLEKLLLACLPIKQSVTFGWKLSVALQSEVLRSPAIAKLHSSYYKVFEADVAREIENLRALGLTSANIDVPFVVARLIALVEGIGTNHALRPRAMPPTLQRRLLLEELSRLKDAPEVQEAPTA
ncbi:MAG: TetR family transcriptional regulator C-terminal domain-containing protein [Ottowia sp.]|uniref:TetR/AcrR family transcriptional regulator n=1 Tax=Ottowia sp. TaxID=1898956 RepID=UPI003C75440C